MPLTVSITIPQPEGNVLHKDMMSTTQRLLETLVQHSSTWLSIRLQLPTECFTFLVSASEDTSFHLPLLEVFVLKGVDPNDLWKAPLFPCHLRLSHASRLRKISFFWEHVHFLSQDIPWGQLTKLNLIYSKDVSYPSTEDDYLGILAQCPNLETCRLQLTSVNVARSVALPKLHTLQVHAHPAQMANFFDHLELRNLRTFMLVGTSKYTLDWVTPVAASLFAFLARSSDTLLELSLRKVAVNPDQMINLLHRLTRLTSLEIMATSSRIHEYATVNEDVIRPITPSEKPLHCLIPYLRSFSLASPGCECGLITEFVRSRWLELGGVVRLDEVMLLLPGLRDEDFEVFEKCRSEGLDINIGPKRRYWPENERYRDLLFEPKYPVSSLAGYVS